MRATNEKKHGALSGIRVIDMSRLAPGPYATMLLADLGACVITVGGGRAGTPLECVSRGKTRVFLNLKTGAGRKALHELVRGADVFVESFRPGVAARLGAGYDELAALNSRLIYCSISGYGADGPMSQEAGHDINYIAVAGMLGALGPAGCPPQLPLNLVADFAGGSLFAAFAIASALVERTRSGLGQYIDIAMIDGVRSMMAMHYEMWGTGAFPSRGNGIMNGAAPFYRCYECADGGYIAVGALERQFFEALWKALGLDNPPAQYPRSQWPNIEKVLAAKFKAKPRDYWVAHCKGVDACVTPVLAPSEVNSYPQMVYRHGAGYLKGVPPVPRMSRAGAVAQHQDPRDATKEVLSGLGMDADEILAAHDTSTPLGLTGWPEM